MKMESTHNTPDLSSLAFDFFFWFSRFEFALKENGYLENHNAGVKAKPGWREFTQRMHAKYSASPEAIALLAAKPEQQIVGAHNDLQWKAVDLAGCHSELEKVVYLLKTVRNNLFHGGKHCGAGWDNPKRTKMLLATGKALLDQLAEFSGLEGDYRSNY